jgi:hypothetical protein
MRRPVALLVIVWSGAPAANRLRCLCGRGHLEGMWSISIDRVPLIERRVVVGS